MGSVGTIRVCSLSSKNFNSPLLFVAGTLQERYVFSKDARLFMYDCPLLRVALFSHYLSLALCGLQFIRCPHYVGHLARGEVGCLYT